LNFSDGFLFKIHDMSIINFVIQRIKSFKPAIQGLKFLLKGEPNVVVHLVATTSAIVLGFVLQLTLIEWILIILCITSVIGAEALNSGIEKTVDLVTKEHQPLAGKAKDLAAAGVLVISLGALIAGILIFGSHVLQLIN